MSTVYPPVEHYSPGIVRRTEFQSGIEILDEAYTRLQSPGLAWQGMDLLLFGLRLKRREWDEETWKSFCIDICRYHPVRQILMQSPITNRAFSKPRGYAGDAVLMDLFYQHSSIEKLIDRASDVGRAIYNYETSTPSAQSVRWRRDFLARTIDETAVRVKNAAILSVACGHLREAQISTAVNNNSINKLVAFDQDIDSLNVIQKQKNGQPIECLAGNIRDLIHGKIKIGKFDLIYSAGLYDYLSDPAAILLTRALFKMLKTDGKLIIANFLKGTTECGYLDSFTDWKLIYRSKCEFERIAASVKKSSNRTFFDNNRNVVYAELRN